MNEARELICLILDGREYSLPHLSLCSQHESSISMVLLSNNISGPIPETFRIHNTEKYLQYT